jgi:hypothetical protein
VRNGVRPELQFLVGKDFVVGGSDALDTRLLSALDVSALYKYGYSMTYHGLNISDGAKKTLIGYAQYVKFIDIGFEAFNRIGAACKFYTPHITEAVATHQRDLLKAKGIQRVIGDGYPSQYTFATDLNIPESYEFCGAVNGMNVSVKRRYRANSDISYATAEVAWSRLIRDLDKTIG